MKSKLTPAELDAQSTINIHHWVDIESEEAKNADDNRAFTKKIILIGFEEKVLFTDMNGRIWGSSTDGTHYYPLHYEDGKKLVGYRMSKTAAN
jgi:hypothetical protein